MDQNLDCAGGSPKEKESVKFLNDICVNYDLIDIWRTRNPDSTLFIWRQKKPLIQRRLDFWLISDFCQDEVEETSIKTAIRTDHSAIIISFNSLDEPRRGPSYWKFNSSLIEDENYISAIEHNSYRNGLWNRPFPSSPGPLYQNEVRCSNILVEMSFICMRMKNHFHIKG